MKRATIALIAAVLAVMLTGCGYNIPSDMVAIHIQEGPFQARKVKDDCIGSGERKMPFTTNDTYYKVPTNEREWDATGQKGSDGDPFVSVTKDSVQMRIPVTVRLNIVTECDTLKDFYTKFLRRNDVEFDDKGNGGSEWKTTMRKLVADPADATLDRIIQDYGWRAVWNDPTTKTEIETKYAAALTSANSLLIQTAKGSYFENITVLVGKPEPLNKELAEAVALEQTNVAKAQSAEAQAKADTAKALAQIAVAEAEAKKKEAEVRGYGGVKNYLMHECITRTVDPCNPFQPTYIWGGGAR